MKEKIYTIPVNDAFNTDCECPLCLLHSQLENEAVDYALGAAMMEPDYRLLSNEKGYCRHHYSMLFKKPNKLSLALVLDTHLSDIRKKLSSLSDDISSIRKEKKHLFKKTLNNPANNIVNVLTEAEKSCVICEKLNTTMARYTDVIFYLWKNDSQFRGKIKNSKGVCIPHFKDLIESSQKYLSCDDAGEFADILYKKELSELERIQEDIHKFTLKFDYRNKDLEWGSAIDAPIRTIEKIASHIAKEEN